MKIGSKIQSKITYCDVTVLIDCKANIRAYHRLIPGDVGVKEGRLATSISDHLNGLAALVILNVKNTDLGTFLGKGQRGGAAHAGSAASDNGYLAGQATIQGFGTCAYDISPETGSDAFATIDDQRVPGHESGHVRR